VIACIVVPRARALVGEQRQVLHLAGDQRRPLGDELGDHVRDVDAGGALDVLVVGVGVGDRRQVVAHPVVLQELHVGRVEGHALPQEHVAAQPAARRSSSRCSQIVALP
jgi:hypothetical protein